MGIFEDLIPGPQLAGDITAQVLDPAGITPPEKIIRENDPWAVKANWHIQGPVAPIVGGDWKVSVYAESMGPGAEANLGSQNVAVNSAPPPSPRNYTATINVPAGTLPAGVYRLVTVLNYSNLGVPQEIAGFAEGPFVQIYDV